MNKLVKFAAVAAFLVASAPIQASTQPASVKSFVSGSIDVRAIDKTMYVYAEYEGETEITEALRGRIAELGYKLVEVPEDADVVFKVTRSYSGKASDRPKIGDTDGSRGFNGLSVRSLLGWTVLGVTTGLLPSPSDGLLTSASKWSFWNSALRDSGAITEIEHAFKPTKKPQDAVVSHIEMTVNGVTQSADVVSESFAEGLPDAVITAENLRQAVWYLE